MFGIVNLTRVPTSTSTLEPSQVGLVRSEVGYEANLEGETVGCAPRSLWEWVRFTNELGRSRGSVVLIHTVFPHSIMF